LVTADLHERITVGIDPKTGTTICSNAVVIAVVIVVAVVVRARHAVPLHDTNNTLLRLHTNPYLRTGHYQYANRQTLSLSLAFFSTRIFSMAGFF
jgi:hypothetical protein